MAEEKKLSVLETLRNKINKNVKSAHADILSQSEIAKIEDWVPTPVYNLNRIIAGDFFKGLPEKTMTLLVAPEACFKSSFMALSMANAQKKGYTPIIIDTEAAWTPEFVERWGIDPDKMLFIHAPFVETATSVIGQFIDNSDSLDNHKLFICVDSIGNLEVEKLEADLLKDGIVKADQGILQKKIKRMLKILLSLCKRQSSICVLSGHFYGSPNQYGLAEEIGGGKHCKLAPHIIISLKKSKMIDKDKKVIGNIIKAITLKNRFYPAFQECIVNIDYQNGVDPYSGLEALAMECGLITKGGAWYTNTVTGKKCQGSIKIAEIIDDELLNKLNEHIQKTGYSSVNEELEVTMKQVEEIIEE